MTFVITDLCRSCVYTDCVQVCPVDAMYDTGEQLIINPDECIECGFCEPECPSEAIFHESELPDAHQASLAYNNDAFNSRSNYPSSVQEMREPSGPSCS